MEDDLLYNVYFKADNEQEWSRGPRQMVYKEAQDVERYYTKEGYNAYIMAALAAFGEGRYE